MIWSGIAEGSLAERDLGAFKVFAPEVGPDWGMWYPVGDALVW
jgi:hypothetical protein